ncbi:MAG: hypothetical protein QOJ41_2006 [Acidobacteriaceae bacterium]|jgi:hypothetical protein|nr:hypothetical protein [Acidobacteriaceae bacterium]
MTLFDPPAEKSNKSRALSITIGALALFVFVLCYFAFRYYPERSTAEHFFDALVAGDTNTAYRLWKPGPSYTMKDFMADWGPQGYYGPVKSYKILKVSAPKKANAIAVRVATSPFSPLPDAGDAEKSRKTRVVSVWVLTQDKSLSFPPE